MKISLRVTCLAAEVEDWSSSAVLDSSDEWRSGHTNARSPDVSCLFRSHASVHVENSSRKRLMAGFGSSIKTASRAKGLIQSIGVNTHLGWLGTPLANISLNLSDIAYLGIDHVRDLAPVGYMLPAYKRMAAQGIKFDLIASDYDQDVEADLPANVALMNQLEEADPGSIFSIEGPNEVNALLTTYPMVERALLIRTPLWQTRLCRPSMPAYKPIRHSRRSQSSTSR